MDRRTFLADAAALAGSGVMACSATPLGAQTRTDDLAFGTGLRRLHVSARATPPLDGSTAHAVFATIQEALDVARPGDVITVARGIYRERPELRDVAGDEALPLWIVAEERGAVIISDCWAEAENGAVGWTDAGDGVFFASRDTRPYLGEHDGDFLMAYLSEVDLRAAEITAYSIFTDSDQDVAKPSYGFAFSPAEGRVYIRLRDGLDPNGQRIKLTSTLGRPTVRVSRSSHVILDGFVIEGAGASQAVAFDNDCQHVTVRNAVFRLARHGVRCPSHTILENCAYHYVGFDRWTRDLFALDGARDNGVFTLIKSYYNAKAVGMGGGRGNALLEGSLNVGYDFPEAQSNILIDRCLIGPCFDGSRIGEFNDSEIRHSIFYQCRDDGFQNEGPKGKPSANNRIHDCRFINCFRDGSHQGRHIVGKAYVYRNLFEWNDPSVAIPNNHSIKMMITPNEAEIYYYQNTWVMDYGTSYGGALRLWTDFGGPKSNAAEIEGFLNNIVVIPHDLSDGRGTNPAYIAGNAVVASSPSTAQFLTANGGVYAGPKAADMGLNADYTLLPDSPARSIAQTLPPHLPDSRDAAEDQQDAGAFAFGEKPGLEWPRALALVFDTDLPPRWTSPGLKR